MRKLHLLFRCAAVAAVLLAMPAAQSAPVSKPVPIADARSLAQQFYERRGGKLAWIGHPAEFKLALAALVRAGEEGMDAPRYQPVLRGDDAARDAAITEALLNYMRDLATGRADLEAVDRDVALPPRSFDAVAALDDALAQGRLPALLAGLAPQHPEYAVLKAALAQHPPEADILAANMERWRWLPPQLEPDRVVVNVADQSLEMWLGGKRLLTSRVVVGKPGWPTPILRAESASLTINPPWNVPRNIAAKEMLPKLKRDPAYLAKNDMVLVNGPPGDPHGLSVNWRAIRAGTFPYQVQQRPGPKNSLGLIKLELPNRFDVYLHDTPAKAAFERPNRAVSHGCVRVEQISTLATLALNDPAAADKIAAAIGQGETQHLPLRKKLPVYLLYWTAVPQADGGVAYLKDIYSRDGRLIAALHAAPLRLASAQIPTCLRG